MTTHKLQEEANELLREALKKKSVKALQSIIKGIKERKAWATIREDQIKEMEELQEALYKAYDDLDEYAVDQCITKINAVLTRGCKARGVEDPFSDS